ncbi:MAG: hypothetical protein HY286_16370 [Planctomycetes bacterium]|nr:hypothetical protein [Planctomycetota bacterium]
MRIAIPFSLQKLIIWLAAFVSPTAFFLLLIVADSYHVPPPPEAVVASLFCIIPVAALIVCESIVWKSNMTTASKIGWMLFTLFALAVQIGLLFVIIISAIGAAIAY